MKPFLVGVVVTILVPLISALVFFKLGLMAINADATPGWFERRMASMSLGAAVRRNAPRMENPVPNNDETLKGAFKVYREKCALCHGGPGGASDLGLSFYPPAPQFVLRKKPFSEPDASLFYIVKHGIRLSGMPTFGSERGKALLKDDEIWGLVHFLKTLPSVPQALEHEWNEAASPSPSGAPATPSPGGSPSAVPASPTESPSATPSIEEDDD